MFIPYKAEVELPVIPISNLFIIGFTFLFFISVYSGASSIDSYMVSTPAFFRMDLCTVGGGIY